MDSQLHFRAKTADLIFAVEKHLGVKRLETAGLEHLQDLTQILFRLRVMDNGISRVALAEEQGDEAIVWISTEGGGAAEQAVKYAKQFQALLERS